MRSYLLFFLLFSTPLFAFDHVLVFTIDTLRPDYLSCYGSTKVKTPNIDSLAKTGVIFKDTVSSAPFTLPSHVSIFTGLIPPAHGVHDNGGFYLDPKIHTLAEILKSHGMRTAAFVGAFPLDSRFGLDQGFDVYDDSYPTVNNISEISMPERKGEVVANSALKWLKSQNKNPWFVWIHFYDPHFPYDPPQRYQQLYPRDLYAGEIAYADEQVGRILNYLRLNKLDKNTLIVLTADHGESLGEHKEKTHGIFAYESTLRVPLIISPFPAGTLESRVRLVDITPTILALLKLPSPEKTEGISLGSLLVTKRKAQPENSYFESLSMHLNAQWAPLRGFYSQNYQYIDLPLPELYDLTKDPKETNNLCNQSTDICKKWVAQYHSFADPFLRKPVAPGRIDSETAEQLRALGYVAGGGSTAKKQYGPGDDPKNLIVYHNRVDAALGFYNRGNDQKAIEILEKIIQERPDYSIAYMHASFIQSEEGAPQKAVEILKQAIRNGISGSDVEGKLGLYLYQAQNYEEAVRHLKIALKEDPKDIDNLNYLGMAYTAAGNFTEAERIFRKAESVDPSDGMTLNNMGTLFLTQKKYNLAIQSLEQALSRNPHIASAYNGLGVAYASQNNWDLAIKNWSASLNENGKNYDAMLNLAYAYLERKDRGRALALLENFEKNAPASKYGEDLPKVRSLIQQLQ